MLRVLKLVIGMALLSCLVLPLSTCSRAPTKLELEMGAPDVMVEYQNPVVSPGEKRPAHLLLALPFVLPLLLGLLTIGMQRFVAWVEVLNLLSALMVIGLVIIHAWLARLAVGGYVAMIASLMLIVVDVVSLRQIMALRRSPS